MASSPSRATQPSGSAPGGGSFVSMVTGCPCLNNVKYVGFPKGVRFPSIPWTERGSHGRHGLGNDTCGSA